MSVMNTEKIVDNQADASSRHSHAFHILPLHPVQAFRGHADADSWSFLDSLSFSLISSWWGVRVGHVVCFLVLKFFFTLRVLMRK